MSTSGTASTSSPPNPTDPSQGDPSMVLLPPAEQWRAQYTVLASTGLADNYLGLAIDTTTVLPLALLFGALWWFPREASANYLFGHFLLVSLVFYAAHSLYGMPLGSHYQGQGLQLGRQFKAVPGI